MYIDICFFLLNRYFNCNFPGEVSLDILNSLLADSRSRWEDVNILLDDRKRKVDYLKESKTLETELNALQELLYSYIHWFNTMDEPEKLDNAKVQQQVEHCRVRISDLQYDEIWLLRPI